MRSCLALVPCLLLLSASLFASLSASTVFADDRGSQLVQLDSELRALADAAEQARVTIKGSHGMAVGVLVGTPPVVVVPYALSLGAPTLEVVLHGGQLATVTLLDGDVDLGLSVYALPQALRDKVKGLELAAEAATAAGALAIEPGSAAMLHIIGGVDELDQTPLVQGLGSGAMLLSPRAQLLALRGLDTQNCSACHTTLSGTQAQTRWRADRSMSDRILVGNEVWELPRINVRHLAGPEALTLPRAPLAPNPTLAPPTPVLVLPELPILNANRVGFVNSNPVASARLLARFAPNKYPLVGSTHPHTWQEQTGPLISAARIARALRDLQEHGRFRQAYLGVVMGDALDSSHQPCASLETVLAGSPAALAKLHPGDVITAIDGARVSGADALTRAIQLRRPGDEIRLRVTRISVKENSGEVTLTLGDRSEAVKAFLTAEALGLQLITLTRELAAFLKVPAESRGLAVDDVRSSSAAEQAGLVRGDVILDADGRPTRDVEEFLSVLAGAKESVRLGILRAGERLELSVKLTGFNHESSPR